MERFPSALLSRSHGEGPSGQTVELNRGVATEKLWAMLPEFRLQAEQIDAQRLVTVNRQDPAHVAFDLIRTKVLQILRQENWTSIAITSPGRDCGKSIVAANLAFSLAHQQDCRTLLVDVDLKEPAIGKLLGIRTPASLSMFLNGDIELNDVFCRYGENLAVATNRHSVTYSAELLQSPGPVGALKAMCRLMSPDVVIYDLPSMKASDDVTAFLPNADCAILVVCAEETTFEELDTCERELSERTNLLGVVLNRCRSDALA